MDSLSPDSLCDATDRCHSAAVLYSALSAPVRLRILESLCRSEKNVGELIDEINIRQPNMSNHLKILYGAGLLERHRQSNQIYYHVIDAGTLVKILSLSRMLVENSDLTEFPLTTGATPAYSEVCPCHV